MKTRQGLSLAESPELAVAEATAGWPSDPQLLIAFSSPHLDPAGISRAFADTFPGASLVGCTTAGEQLGKRHQQGSLVALGIWDSSIRWATASVGALDTFDSQAAQSLVNGMLGALDADRETLESRDFFAVLLIDGLAMLEEKVGGLMAHALEGIPLVGGSAGDDLGFHQTHVYTEQGALTNGAVVLIGHRGHATVRVLKHQHYVTTPTALCVTRADPSQRVVHEIDGYPALDAYARALGLAPDQVTDDITFLNPLIFSINGEIYVRSIKSLNADGSISLYCAIEEGMVLELGSQRPMVDVLRTDLAKFTADSGRPSLLIGFNCILRALEAGKLVVETEIGEVLAEHSDSMIGFDTYGEQLNGLHINQTLVALAISEK